MFSFFKKDDGVNDYVQTETVHERRTTILGYLLLAVMVVFIVSIAQTIFNDLSRIPERPERISNCLYSTQQQVNGSYYRNNYECNPSSYEIKHGVKLILDDIKPARNEIIDLSEQIRELETRIGGLKQSLVTIESTYNLTLQEKIADEESLYEKDAIKVQISELQIQIQQSETSLSRLKTERTALQSSVQTLLVNLETAVEQARDDYSMAFSWYKLKVFFLSVLFVLPLFGFSLYKYLSLKRRNSQYTIIFTAFSFATSLLFIQVVFMMLYDVLLRHWIDEILMFFLALPFLRYILYYGGILLTLLVFGGVVYFIQKRVFDPNKVAIRRLKDNKCPNCSFTINRREGHCPSCGIQLKEKCLNCGIDRLVYLPFCPACGATKEQNEHLEETDNNST